ncbi:hypothetical protein [Acinetobacter bereziniae]|uniref:DNA polymerase III subunit beta family protein n=1 Tax=Acinetobacter bereziniae TaxID=106648 RepID=UPI003AF672F9
MNNIFEIPLVLLKAALICASKNDIRFYLNGVAIDQGHIVATDGHRMFYAPLESANELPQIIIPRDAIEYLIKKTTSVGKKHPEKVLVKVGVKDNQWSLCVSEYQENFRPIDGKFPEWKRIIPKSAMQKYEGQTLMFNWSYMADFQKIAKILGCKNQGVELSPSNISTQPAIIDFYHPYFPCNGVIMPMRN